MKVVNNKYYSLLDKYIPGHISLSLVPDFYSGEYSYICTENSTEYRAIFKLRRLINYSMYRMCKSNTVSYGFKWENLG
jgi:hypothetical protein